MVVLYSKINLRFFEQIYTLNRKNLHFRQKRQIFWDPFFKNADLICVMHEGEIVERGKHDELIALNGYYKKLVDMQNVA